MRKSINLEIYLIEILEDTATWFDKGNNNQKAKNALNSFYKEFLKLEPEEIEYITTNGFHLSYLQYLFAIQKAMNERKYMKVNNEIISLLHYEPFLQPRIYFNLIRLIKTFLEEK